MNDLKANLHNICSRVESACKAAGRDPSEIQVLAVSKRHPSDRIRLLNDLGQTCFGENYVQEALAKQSELRERAIEWHFIGPIQSNKTREIAAHFSWVQSADRSKILRRLSEQRPRELPPLNICLQVNIDREPQKAGLMPEAVADIAEYTRSLENLRLRGLMAIPRVAAPGEDPADSFKRMRTLFDQLVKTGIPMDTLSMGMSGDMEPAIAEGSTMIRIGTALLGARA